MTNQDILDFGFTIDNPEIIHQRYCYRSYQTYYETEFAKFSKRDVIIIVMGSDYILEFRGIQYKLNERADLRRTLLAINRY
jgi:hypothetical protein